MDRLERFLGSRPVIVACLAFLAYGLLFDTLDTLASIIRSAVVIGLLFGAAYLISNRPKDSSPKSF